METPSSPHRPRRGGRPPATAEQKQTHTVPVRLTEAEHTRLVVEAEQYHKSKAEVLRAGWLGGVVSAPLPPLTVEQVALLRQLAGMANNLNQVTRMAHTAGYPRMAEAIAQTLQQVNQILNQW